MSQIKRILVPTDFSAASEVAFNYALDIAFRDGATMHLLHVLEEQSFAAAYPDGSYVELPHVRQQLIREAEARLAAAGARCADVSVTATTQVVVGQPDPTIVQQAMDRRSDVIVMGTHGRKGFAHLMLGSVAERVLRTAPCPVLTVRDTSRTADILAIDVVAHRQPAPHGA
jgi:nucleotide-binding universal stress UspA family protein